jgi:hypothetical protein
VVAQYSNDASLKKMIHNQKGWAKDVAFYELLSSYGANLDPATLACSNKADGEVR